ncbi:SurA N-terminal domain-containing protein [Acidicapsa dinghuensis]|uniref:SurA N-terminal domain-containing protein n=1 Tax=Acidicapsa dinghuensis TaxID=2218256 RepID=A0ABW1E9B8_9BACT|nr:SurA N-terminal domain-containing protein [Acidicapsa dinghuensis]
MPSASDMYRTCSFPAARKAAGVVSLALVLGVAGCHRSPSANVIATVNGKEIPVSELDRVYKQSVDPSAPPLSREEEGVKRLQFLHSLIENEILQQRAAKLNLVATDEEVDAKVTDMKSPYTQEEFDQKLKERNETLQDLRRDIRNDLTRSKLMNKEIESKINVTDADISNYYNAHKSDFNLIEPDYHLARIVVSNQPSKQVANLQNNKATNDAEAKKKIQLLRSRLDSGADFYSLAAQFSEDSTSSPSGGDIGFIPESQLREIPDVFNAIDKLKAGQATDVLPTFQGEGSSRKTTGYAIYLLIEKRPAGQRELNNPNVRQSIRQLLRNNHQQLLQQAYIEMLYDDAKVHNYLAEDIFKKGGL